MKKFLIFLGLMFILMFNGFKVLAAEGEKIFKKLNCHSCHYQKEEGFAPSLKSISKAYKNKKEELIKYLKGEAKAIIDIDREDFMKPYIKQTKSLESKDLDKLADYLLSF